MTILQPYLFIFCSCLLWIISLFFLHQKYSIKHVFVVLLMGLYTIFSFWNLGTLSFPQTTWQSKQDQQSITFQIQDESPTYHQIITIYGERQFDPDQEDQIGLEGTNVYGSFDQENWVQLGTLYNVGIYRYQQLSGKFHFPYIRFTFLKQNQTCTEIGFLNQDTKQFLPIRIVNNSIDDLDQDTLIDEQTKLVAYPTYQDEFYFDEVYHVRNAYEIAHQTPMYDYVHPLLGTSFIALFIHWFGFAPFIFRLPGVLCGIFAIPLFYLLSKKCFEKAWIANFATTIFTFDFMHMTTSRIATLEPFSIIWIITMYYFMLCFTRSNLRKLTFQQQLKPLFFCGLCLSFGLATKWTVAYSAIGLAILFFQHVITQYFPFQPNDWKILVKLCLCCIGIFIVMPITIYCLSFAWIPFSQGYSIQQIFQQNIAMFNYHVHLTATHPYQSSWYHWLLNIRPVWYHYSIDQHQFVHTIACFSHPLFILFAITSIPLLVKDAFKQKKIAQFILIALGTTFLPWLLITRSTFAYHFYPSSLFFILSLSYACQWFYHRFPTKKYLIGIYLIIYFLIFLLYYPILSGLPVTQSYLKALELLPTWYWG